MAAPQEGAAPSGPGKRRKTLRLLVVAFSVAIACAALAILPAWRRVKVPVPDAALEAALASPWRNARPDVVYVGDQACAGCHADHAESYGRHPMGRSLAPLRQAPPLQQFDPPTHDPFEALGFQ